MVERDSDRQIDRNGETEILCVRVEVYEENCLLLLIISAKSVHDLQVAVLAICTAVCAL